MALVKELRVGGPNGAIVRVWDDDYAGCTPEELDARRRNAGRVVRQVLEDQIKRGIMPTVKKIDLPEVTVIYDRARDGARPN